MRQVYIDGGRGTGKEYDTRWKSLSTNQKKVCDGLLLVLILSQPLFDTQEFVEAFVCCTISLTHFKILAPFYINLSTKIDIAWMPGAVARSPMQNRVGLYYYLSASCTIVVGN